MNITIAEAAAAAHPAYAADVLKSGLPESVTLCKDGRRSSRSMLYEVCVCGMNAGSLLITATLGGHDYRLVPYGSGVAVYEGTDSAECLAAVLRQADACWAEVQDNTAAYGVEEPARPSVADMHDRAVRVTEDELWRIYGLCHTKTDEVGSQDAVVRLAEHELSHGVSIRTDDDGESHLMLVTHDLQPVERDDLAFDMERAVYLHHLWSNKTLSDRLGVRQAA